MNPDAEADRLQGAALSPRPPGEGSWLLGLLFLVGVQGGFTFAAPTAAGWALEVLSNGTVLVRGSSPEGARTQTTEVSEWCYEFGLPESWPLRQSPTNGVSSVLVTEWEHQRMRYVQSILCAGFGPEEDPIPVLLVQDLSFDDELRRVRKLGAAAGSAGWSPSAQGSWLFPAVTEAESRP